MISFACLLFVVDYHKRKKEKRKKGEKKYIFSKYDSSWDGDILLASSDSAVYRHCI